MHKRHSYSFGNSNAQLKPMKVFQTVLFVPHHLLKQAPGVLHVTLPACRPLKLWVSECTVDGTIRASFQTWKKLCWGEMNEQESEAQSCLLPCLSKTSLCFAWSCLSALRKAQPTPQPPVNVLALLSLPTKANSNPMSLYFITIILSERNSCKIPWIWSPRFGLQANLTAVCASQLQPGPWLLWVGMDMLTWRSSRNESCFTQDEPPRYWHWSSFSTLLLKDSNNSTYSTIWLLLLTRKTQNHVSTIESKNIPAPGFCHCLYYQSPHIHHSFLTTPSVLKFFPVLSCVLQPLYYCVQTVKFELSNGFLWSQHYALCAEMSLGNVTVI